MMDYTHYLEFATALARRGSAQIMPFFQGAAFSIAAKGNDPRNLVTEADIASERAMAAMIREQFPAHAILGEEGTGTGIDSGQPTWVLDPIDGTNNFSHRFPLFAVNVALMIAGKPRVAVTYAPVMEWLFAATEGGGATLNGQPLHVSERTSLLSALVSCEWPRHPLLRRAAANSASTLLEHILAFRSMGSAALSLAAVAAGWLDAYYNYHLAVWDIAAGALLIQEAGGAITHLNGSPLDFRSSTVLASNGHLHSLVMPLIERLD